MTFAVCWARSPPQVPRLAVNTTVTPVTGGAAATSYVTDTLSGLVPAVVELMLTMARYVAAFKPAFLAFNVRVAGALVSLSVAVSQAAPPDAKLIVAFRPVSGLVPFLVIDTIRGPGLLVPVVSLNETAEGVR